MSEQNAPPETPVYPADSDIDVDSRDVAPEDLSKDLTEGLTDDLREGLPEGLNSESANDAQSSGLPAEGDVTEGKIVRVKPYGAIVQLADKRLGLVHISHISGKFVRDVRDYVDVGDVVNVRILSIDDDGHKISLSMRDVRQPSRAMPDRVEPTEPRTFEDKFKEWVKSSNERQAGINKRNKRR